jgi:hypothetical protein
MLAHHHLYLLLQIIETVLYDIFIVSDINLRKLRALKKSDGRFGFIVFDEYFFFSNKFLDGLFEFSDLGCEVLWHNLI